MSPRTLRYSPGYASLAPVRVASLAPVRVASRHPGGYVPGHHGGYSTRAPWWVCTPGLTLFYTFRRNPGYHRVYTFRRNPGYSRNREKTLEWSTIIGVTTVLIVLTALTKRGGMMRREIFRHIYQPLINNCGKGTSGRGTPASSSRCERAGQDT